MMSGYLLELKTIPQLPMIPLWVYRSANDIQAMYLVEDIKHSDIIAFISRDRGCPVH
jgi:hypothetical protein